ncbi:hypothetical protein CGRA01v4_00923 [Colletotrichum graminicola]|nr:hypothetical protein CGRA01v4_00923 [Colletotrichum graminicola]
MADNHIEMTHAEMWDDSALINSWNEALDEYKKYHSIHAKGGKLEDGDLQWETEPQTIDAQTKAADQPEIVDDDEGGNKTKGAACSSTDVKQPIAPSSSPPQVKIQADQKKLGFFHSCVLFTPTNLSPARSQVQTNPSGVATAEAIPGPATTGPQSLLGTVQDEGLKRLLMSWYYAGYYTGLYEGQQQQQSK